MENVMEYLRQLNMVSMMLRIVLAVIMGGLIGLERERKRRPAGFRTYIIVAVGATVTILLSQYLDLMLKGAWSQQAALVGVSHDVSRFGAQVINGMGFLGAGTIIVTGRDQVKGLTTAAGLWASACLGLAIGAGFYECMIVAVALISMCMYIFPRVENHLKYSSRSMNISIELESMENVGEMANYLREAGVKIYDLEINRSKESAGAQFGCRYGTLLPKGMRHAELLAELSTLDGVTFIEET